jgi:hypothetical protein
MAIHRGPGYEVRDTSVRAIVLFGVGLAILCLIAQVGLWGLLKVISGGQPEPPSPFKAPDLIREQRARLHAREHAALEGGYGWNDKAAGTVKIPIDDAMKLVAERGLPVTSTTPRTEVDINSHAGKKAAPEEAKAKP